MKRESGKYWAMWLPSGLDELAEKARQKLGMSRSRFLQYCVLKTLQELSVLTSKVHEDELHYKVTV